MWAYDIKLHNKVVGDSGEMVFETKEEALIDAQEYIDTLSIEYDTPSDKFGIQIFVSPDFLTF